MPTITQQSTISLPPQSQVTVSADAISSGKVYRLGANPGDEPFSPIEIAPGTSKLIGPFITTTRFSVVPEVGSLSHTEPAGENRLLLPRWQKFTLSYSQFVADDVTADATIAMLPAGTVVHAVKQKHSVAFTGGDVSACTVSVGVSGNLTKYAAAHDVFQEVGSTVQQITGTVGTEDHAAEVALIARLTTTTANTSELEAGTLDIWVLTSVAL